MKTLFIAAAALLAVALHSPAAAVDYTLKQPLGVHAFKTECVHFRLDGVAVADASINATSPFFGLLKNHPNFNELFAILLTARAGKQPINVYTTNGERACGLASVWGISLE